MTPSAILKMFSLAAKNEAGSKLFISGIGCEKPVFQKNKSDIYVFQESNYVVDYFKMIAETSWFQSHCPREAAYEQLWDLCAYYAPGRSTACDLPVLPEISALFEPDERYAFKVMDGSLKPKGFIIFTDRRIIKTDMLYKLKASYNYSGISISGNSYFISIKRDRYFNVCSMFRAWPLVPDIDTLRFLTNSYS